MTEDKRDTIFVVDRTGSMVESFERLGHVIIRYSLQQVEQIRYLGLVLFDDHYPPTYPNLPNVPTIEVKGLTDDLEEFAWWLRSCPPGDGADGAEAIACAIASARQLSPRARYWLITDGEPHGGEHRRGGFPDRRDNFLGGCPCGIPLDMTGVLCLFPEESRFWHSELIEKGQATIQTDDLDSLVTALIQLEEEQHALATLA